MPPIKNNVSNKIPVSSMHGIAANPSVITVSKIDEDIQSSLYIPIEGISNEQVILPVYIPIEGMEDDTSYILSKTESESEWVMANSNSSMGTSINIISYIPVSGNISSSSIQDDISMATGIYMNIDNSAKSLIDEIVEAQIPKYDSIKSDGSFNNTDKSIDVIVVNDQAKQIINSGGVGIISNDIPNSGITINTNYRKNSIIKYNFDYVSYLLFEVNINRGIEGFYGAIDWIIKNREFEREEDYNENYRVEDELDNDMIGVIFDRLWSLAKLNGVAVKNLIGFYIYFNRRLRFLPMLIQGISVNELIAKMDIGFVLNRINEFGLYPVRTSSLFERVWSSEVLSVNENENEAESIMSINEYYGFKSNLDIDGVYEGFPTVIDNLLLKYYVDKSSWNNSRMFSSSSLAFNRFKELSIAYVNDNDGLKKYLLNLLPSVNNVYMKESLLNEHGSSVSPDLNLWGIMQSFDDEFKVNRIWINKNEIHTLFDEFVNDEGFPVEYVDGGSYVNLWIAWIKYLNGRGVVISNALVDADGVNHDYIYMFDNLIKMLNAKFIINYIGYNRAFMSADYDEDGVYTIGTDIVDIAISRIYASIAVLKEQIKNVIEYMIVNDKRFYSDHA
jgi:hypothetical protein